VFVTVGPDLPPIRFAHAGHCRLAYQIFGDGPNIVAIPPTAQHIEMAWEWPDIRSMLEQFGSFSRYLHFDKRGTGASDRRSRIPGIDERVEDLRAVMDDAGVESAHLFACSEGGPMAILFAATYPNRVESLIFNGSCAAQVPPDATDEDLAVRRAIFAEFTRRWGTSESLMPEGFAPSLAANPDFVRWHQRYERSAADTDSLLDLLELTLEMDVRDVLPTLDVPTLVLHRECDRVIPVEWGRELATQIPGARMVVLEGEDHFQYAGDVRAWMDEVERFVTGTVSRRTAPGSSPTVEIVTLGRFALLHNGVELPTAAWGSRLARQVCKRLVAARGWPVTREQLIDMCWPDETDMRRLGARLSVQLSAVRRMLGGGVVADRSSVRLDLDYVATDIERLFTADDDEAIVAAYGGDFLPDDLYEDWTGPMRDEARTRFVTAGHRLAETVHDPDRRIWLAHRLISADRFDEQAHRLLVTTLLSADELSEAERAHTAWADAMSELGVDVDSLATLRRA